ncbi:LysM peptidoglycan-binding domain-containing protein [Sporosarcina limicola]|uniref:LysM repeat protein n=1 Tax=Sporosarcina limicola TaxID=34101 RepID=A0A927R3D1_9BACL|nr:peptidoglycan endopeptidase [Sporosarcina limicola]MBE1554956.1 LysM repeat protein [Sporosarcina limicola]
MMKKKRIFFPLLAMLVLATFITTGNADAAADYYTVKSGDTLGKIAKQHNLTIEELKKLNNLTSDTIKIKQKLVIYGKEVNSKSAIVPKKTVTANPKLTTASYTVKAGDTLGKIAKQHKLTIDELLNLNYLTSDTIKINQTITVPGKISNPKSSVVPKNTFTANLASTTSFYTVKLGDTLWQIASQHDLTIDELMTLNKLTSDTINVNQKLIVPGKVSNPKSSIVPKKTLPPASSLSKSGGTKTTSATKKSTSSKGTQFAAVEASLPFLDTPSVWGGSTVEGFDSSGFIYHVFNNAELYIPRWDTLGMYTNSYYVDKPLPGDLVFFENTYQSGISHVGIFLGGNNFIHSGTKKVEITSLSSIYWKDKFTGFKRFNRLN